MKLLKKLLPIVSMASAAVCVAPVITACSKNFMSTTDIEYKAIEHPEVQLENKNAVIDEYFKDPKYFASDAMVYGAAFAKEAKEELAKEFKTGFSFDARMTVNSINIGEAKTITISSKETYGYVFSTKMSIYLHLAGEQEDTESNSDTSLEKMYGVVKGTYTFDISNCFATLEKYEDGWYVETSALAAASDTWVFSKIEEINEYVEFTYKDGTKKSMDAQNINSEYKSKQCDHEDVKGVLPEYIASSFAKVTTKE